MTLPEKLFAPLKNFIYGKPLEPGQRVYILPEHLRPLVPQKITTKEIITVAKEPSLELFGLSLALKSLAQNPSLQKQLLSYALTADLAANTPQIIESFFKDHQDAAVVTVSAEKLAKIAFWNPYELTRQANEISQEIHAKHKVPVIVAYSGILALSGLLKNMREGESLYIVDPQRISEVSVGFEIIKKGSGYIVRDADKKELSALSNAALVDDTSHSGKTFRKVSSLLSHGNVELYSLFDLPFERP